MSYCDNATISSVLVLRPSQIWKYVMSHDEGWLDFICVISGLFSCFIVLKLFSVKTYDRTSNCMLLSDYNVLVFGTYWLNNQQFILSQKKVRTVTSVLLQCLFRKLCYFSYCIHQVEALTTWHATQIVEESMAFELLCL